jgi:DNA-binding NarL/FixJ family response regulator
MAKKYNILHLDDSLLFLEFTKMILDEDELSYHPVSTEREVEDYFKQHKPDLFICDLMLYDESDAGPGVELIEEIHKKYPSVKIMVFSARSDDSLKERLKDKTAYYATKNIRDSELKSIVISLVKGVEIVRHLVMKSAG